MQGQLRLVNVDAIDDVCPLLQQHMSGEASRPNSTNMVRDYQ